jgi:hypothetical protein
MRKPLFSAVLLLVLSPAIASSPAPSEPGPRYLRAGECLDPSFARGFTAMDNRHLLIDAGSRHYLVELEASCWNLDFANVIGFRGDPVSQRVCGGFNESIVFRGERPCRIERMSLVTKDEYKAALKDRDAWRKAHRSPVKPKDEAESSRDD